MSRPWCGDVDPMVEAKKKCDAAFEFFTKLGVEYYCFHDRDIVAEGETLEETNRRLDEISDYMLEKQKQTGVKLLWGTANMFGDRVFMNGASTNPDAHVFALAAAQVKKAMDITPPHCSSKIYLRTCSRSRESQAYSVLSFLNFAFFTC